jgi:predicted ester cyclase
MAAEYESFMHRWFDEVWNQRSEAAIGEMFAEDGIANGLNDPEGNPLRGPESFKTLHRAFLSAYPDLHITVDDVVAEGDKVAARCTVRATHAGEGLGCAPTNRPIEFTGLVIVKLKDDKIVEAWNEFDFMKMYAQVGALSLKLNNFAAAGAAGYETIIHRWFDEVWNQKREAAIDEMLAADSIHHGLGGADGGAVEGVESFKEFFRRFVALFPDLQVTVEDVVTDGEKISARYSAGGTHAPTGKEVEFTGMGICTVRDGKFVEVWNEVDFMKMYSQIDALTLNL